MSQTRKNIFKNWRSGILLLSSSEPMNAIMLSDITDGNRKEVDALFQFRLRYSEPPEYFEELSRYVIELEEYSGRKGVFKGTVVIECTQWLGSEQSEYFDAFIAYLCDHHTDIHYVISVSNEYPVQTTEMKEKLEEYFPVFYAEYENQSQANKNHTESESR